MMKLRTIKNCISAAFAALTASLLLLLCLFSVEIQKENIGASVILSDAMLGESADAGEEYLTRMVFFGESTTAHLARTGGVLDTAAGHRQVWKDASGTRMLNRRILASTVDYTDENGICECIPFEEAVMRAQPAYMVLSFGLNGIVGFTENVSRFTETYRYLIESIHTRSPSTRISLQSVYPVRSADNFSVDVDTLNQKIALLNGHIATLAEALPYVRYADTASVLSDASGALSVQYDSGDGIHLTNKAYEKILFYLRTHAWA
ncbi:MAG: hypothetical protein IJX80_10515 [Clostridia bacterium]|nr:hypothetical protein [Clostridia bacterium]